MGKDVEDHRFSCGFMIREREDYELFKSYIGDITFYFSNGENVI